MHARWERALKDCAWMFAGIVLLAGLSDYGAFGKAMEVVAASVGIGLGVGIPARLLWEATRALYR